MRPEQLAEHYPQLFHMAWQGSWDSIRKRGLLSTQSLVQLCGLGEDERNSILQQHRPNWVEISSPQIGTATVRDQKPMDDAGVRKALGGGDPRRWYELLNSMVFLWPTLDRLRTMMGARAYAGMSHDLLLIDTAKLVIRHENNIRLSPMNSGATKPFPHPRDLQLFRTFNEFPFDARLKSHKQAKAVAEVCVVRAIPDIADLVVEVRTVSLDDLDRF